MEWTSIVPVIDFTFNNSGTCSGTPITFNPSVSGIILYLFVDFGDGGSATAVILPYLYSIGLRFSKFYCSTKSYRPKWFKYN
jgi:hypothetical protein